MNRRMFFASVTGGLLAAPLAAEGQPAGTVYRIVSIVDVMPSNPVGRGPLFDRLRELGWVHGQNVLERLAYGDHIERIPDLAAEAMRSGVDIFIAPGSIGSRRLQPLTRTITIVAANAGDLVQEGSRPASPDLAATSPASRPSCPR